MRKFAIFSALALVAAGSISLRTLSSTQLSPAELYRRNAPSTFLIRALDRHQRTVAWGSAVAVAGGLLLTNLHVVDHAATIEAAQGARVWPARLRRCDEAYDLCLLAINDAVPGARLRSGPLEPGERVYALGSPEGIERTISEGLVSGLRRIGGQLMIVTSAPMSEGSSGGGLFDQFGRLVGITTSQVSNGQDLNLAIPADAIAALLNARQ